MLKYLYLIIFFTVLTTSYSADDSLKVGSTNTITLKNGFKITGTVTRISDDTIYIFTKDKEIAILRSSIRYKSYIETEIDENVITNNISDECNIYLNNGIKKKSIQLFYMNDSSIIAFNKNDSDILQISDIRKIKFPAGGGFIRGAGYGSIVGFLVGGLVVMSINRDFGGANNSPPFIPWFFIGGVIGAVPAALMGGIIGTISDKDVDYLFPSGNSPAKLKKLRYIISKHS